MGLGAHPDVVIIGAGAGGAAAAWRLCSQGVRVLLLEAGPWFDPVRDYRLDQPDWERQRFPKKPDSQAEILFGDLGALKQEDAALASFSRVGGRANPTATRVPSANGYSHVQGVGGSTLHFVGEAHRMNPASMKLGTEFGNGQDWPLRYEDLEPYYTACETQIGVAGPVEVGARWRSAPYPLPAHPLSPSSRRIKEAGKAFGAGWEANSRAALSRSYHDRPACNYCGGCSYGCPLGDKGSVDVAFVSDALATGLLNVKANCPVISLEPGADGRVSRLTYVEEGKAVVVETPKLILAAGAVQSPRMLLNSANSTWPDGAANSSGQVGQNFLETLFYFASGLSSDLRNSHMGLPDDAICWDWNAPGSVPNATGGFRLTASTIALGLNGPIAYGQRLIDGFGAGFKERLRASFGSAVSVGAMGETIADARSFVALSTDRKDRFGVPLPVIHSVLTPNSLALMHAMHEQVHAHLAAAGAEVLEAGGSWDQFTATHVFGTCRMGDDPKSSVVNAFGRSHDIENLFVTDASVMPSSGGGESPSLTIQALALRTADHIVSG